MLSLDTLTKKPITVNRYGENIIDLTSPTFIYKNDVTVISQAIVSTGMEMRPDLVALTYYGNISKLDYILKFNGISNPFSLDSGTILLIGDASEMDANFVTANQDSESKTADLRAKFFDPNRLSIKDAKRLSLIQNNSKQYQNAASNLPPNMADIGSKEISSTPNGTVVLGNDVVANTNNCPVVQSRAALQARLLQAKIFANIGPTNAVSNTNNNS